MALGRGRRKSTVSHCAVIDKTCTARATTVGHVRSGLVCVHHFAIMDDTCVVELPPCRQMALHAWRLNTWENLQANFFWITGLTASIRTGFVDFVTRCDERRQVLPQRVPLGTNNSLGLIPICGILCNC